MTKHTALQRRTTERLASEVVVDIHGDNNFYAGFAGNLSEGGVFVSTFRPMEIGDRLRIRICLPNVDDPVDAKVEVRWLRAGDPASDLTPGFGAAFVELSDAGREAIERFIEARAPLFFEE